MAIALRAFTSVQARANKGLHVSAETGKVFVAKKTVIGRALTACGALPGFRNLPAVKHYVEARALINANALMQFAETLSAISKRPPSDLVKDMDATKLTTRLIRTMVAELNPMAKAIALGTAETAAGREWQSAAPDEEPIHQSLTDLRLDMSSKASETAQDEEPIHWSIKDLGSAQQARKGDASIEAQTTELKKRLLALPAPVLATEVSFNRFRDLPMVAATQVGKLPVNRIMIAERARALAGSFPVCSTDGMANHFRMLVEEGCSSLHVLAGDDQLDGVVGKKATPMLSYFKPSGDGQPTEYDGVRVSSRLIEERTLGEVKANVYELRIELPEQEPFLLPTLHVVNWGDHKALGSAEDLKLLAQLGREVDARKDLRGEAVYENVGGGTPMVHCRGGVGRTGTYIAAMDLVDKDSEFSVERLVSDQRLTRSKRMVEDDAQLKQLIELAEICEKPVLEVGEGDYVNLVSTQRASRRHA